MYHVVYGLLYAVSLLPLGVLHLFSSFAAFIMYSVIGYRKEVVMSNLLIAFPEKTEKERKKIARQFYLNFTDSFIESIKMLSISKRELERRAQTDLQAVHELLAEGKSINLMAAHQFNWELGNLICSLQLNASFIGVYQPIASKALNRVYLKSRQRFGTILISTREFKNKMHQYYDQQYVLALAADQNPTNRTTAYWLHYFGRPVPFITGPAKGAVKNGAGVVFLSFQKVKRGHYFFKAHLITKNGSLHTPEELTMKYRDIVEETVRQNPSNYLWSHRRWRHNWRPEYSPILD